MNARDRVLQSSPFALKLSKSFIAAMKKERIQLIEEQNKQQMVAKLKAALAARSLSQRKSNLKATVLNGIRNIFSTQQNSRFETPPPTPPRTSPLVTEFIELGSSPVAKGGYNSRKYKKPTILPKKPKKATILPKKPKKVKAKK